MKLLTVLILSLVATTAPSHAATAWKISEAKDSDGNTVCVYKHNFKKVYQTAELGTICPMTIEVNDD
jgi:hypothetical protein